MSVEKFTVTKEDSGYTTLPNSVLQNLRNVEALGLWAYFQSLPSNWEFYKGVIYEHFGFGRDKLKKLCEILEQCNLVEITQIRDSKGKFSSWLLHVKNGSDFKPFTENPSSDNSPLTCSPLTANQSLENSTYKRNTKKSNKEIKKETKSFCSKAERKKDNQKKHDFADSMDQMANEKKHIEEHERLKQVHAPQVVKNVYSHLRDFTEERLQREAQQAKGQAHDSQQNDYGNQSRSYGMRSIKDYLF